jgi:cytochrome c2
MILDAFLTDPQALVPGTAMPFGGIRNSPQRLALVCYLLGGRLQ